MALSGVEYLEVCVAEPSADCFVNGYIVAINSGNTPPGALLGGNSVVRRNVSTGVVAAFDGTGTVLPGGGSGGWYPNPCDSDGTYAYWTNGVSVASFAPSSGVTSVVYSGPGSYNGAAFAVTDNSFGATPASGGHVNLSSGSRTTLAGAGSDAIAASASMFYRCDGTTLYEITASTNSVSATHTYAGGARKRGTWISNRIYWGHDTHAAVWFDIVTGTSGHIAATPAGFVNMGVEWVSHSDGYLYRSGVVGGKSVLQILDPATNRWALEEIIPNRGRRGYVVSDGTNLWVPSGEPLNRS